MTSSVNVLLLPAASAIRSLYSFRPALTSFCASLRAVVFVVAPLMSAMDGLSV